MILEGHCGKQGVYCGLHGVHCSQHGVFCGLHGVFLVNTLFILATMVCFVVYKLCFAAYTVCFCSQYSLFWGQPPNIFIWKYKHYHKYEVYALSKQNSFAVGRKNFETSCCVWLADTLNNVRYKLHWLTIDWCETNQIC